MDHHREFTYQLATRIHFGVGSVGSVGARVKSLGGSRALLVTDEALVKVGIVDKVVAGLDAADVEHVLYAEVAGEPEASLVQEGVETARSRQCDSIVAVGGGSSLDLGKAISVMATNSGHIRDYAGQDLVKERGLPMIAVPTTAGTGSETTIWAVISEKDRNVKYGVGSQHVTADEALCDPQLSLSLPASMTATTGLDALAHALESYVNKATQPISEALSEKAMEMIAGSLRTAVAAGDQLWARSEMLLAATIAGAAFNPTRLGLAHALAMPLGSKANIPHGDVVSILLPEVMRYNVVGNLDKFARIARIFGEPTDGLSLRDAADAGVEAVARLAEDVSAPRHLAEYGVEQSALPEYAEEAMQSGNVPVNPRLATAGDLVGIMRRCL